MIKDCLLCAHVCQTITGDSYVPGRMNRSRGDLYQLVNFSMEPLHYNA